MVKNICSYGGYFMKKYIVKSKARFLISMGTVMFVVISLLFTLAVSARVNNDVTMVPEYIEAGDTLWSISRKYADNMDIREYISIVMEINDLQSANIKPGELLYFPSYK